MWYLEIKGRRIYLTPKEEIIFGRKKGHVLVSQDISISRKHASFCIKRAEMLEEDKPISVLTVKDLNSKHGSYVVREGKMTRISAEGCQVASGDQVLLGLLDTIITVTYVPILPLTSCLSKRDKLEHARFLCDYIDGVPLWRPANCCTHLTVKQARLTKRVAWALAAGVPIVTIDYWKQVGFAMERGEPIPDPKDFTPSIKDPVTRRRHLLLNTKKIRKTLFKDKIFVFLHVEQYEIHKDVIEAAGGNAYLYSRKRFILEDLCAPQVIVLQYPFWDQPQYFPVEPDYNDICIALKASRRAIVLPIEIPLALLYCSMERFCNPTYKARKILGKMLTHYRKNDEQA